MFFLLGDPIDFLQMTFIAWICHVVKYQDIFLSSGLSLVPSILSVHMRMNLVKKGGLFPLNAQILFLQLPSAIDLGKSLPRFSHYTLDHYWYNYFLCFFLKTVTLPNGRNCDRLILQNLDFVCWIQAGLYLKYFCLNIFYPAWLWPEYRWSTRVPMADKNVMTFSGSWTSHWNVRHFGTTSCYKPHAVARYLHSQ